MFGVPYVSSTLPMLNLLVGKVDLNVLVDYEDHMLSLNCWPSVTGEKPHRWPIFIRVGRGSSATDRLQQLLDLLPESENVYLRGLYCDAGELCGTMQPSDTAEAILEQQMTALIMAAELVGEDIPLVLSAEATSSKDVAWQPRDPLPHCWKLEYRSGDFIVNDLQRVTKGLATTDDIAIQVLAEVVTPHPERKEPLINAGATALSREISTGFPGFGTVSNYGKWFVDRLTQEQGILATNEEGIDARAPYESTLSLLVQNAGVTANAYKCYFVVGGRRDIVLEVWHRWSEW